MKPLTIKVLVAAGILTSLAFGQANQTPPLVLIAGDHASGVYKVGETVHWKISSKAPISGRYRILAGGLTEVGKGEVNVTAQDAEITYTFHKPGTALLDVRVKDPDGKEQKALGGAVADPDRIPTSSTAPADFDEFWKTQIAELAKIPANPKIDQVDLGKPEIVYSKITMDNIGGSKIRGQIARPSKGDKFPAMLIVQWAGVYPLEKGWVTGRATEGWLTLNINAHDLPIDEPADFYKQQNDGSLKNYPAIGNQSRETSYFRRMYLSCYRAAEYLTTRDDWDGKTLVVTGTSQGGLQTLVTAAIHPKITGALALVPAGCDLTGPEVGRAPGWPQWYWAVQGKDAKAVREAGRYYDVVNFAPKIKCPILIGLGLIDETCPPAGVLAAFNQIPGPKETVIMAKATHQRNQADYQKRANEVWLPALRQGQVPPVEKR